MKSMKVLSILALVVALGGSASYASSSAVTITGSGNVTITGFTGAMPGATTFPSALDTDWVDVSVAPAAPDSASAGDSHYMEWLIGWATDPTSPTTFTANFLVVQEDLQTANAGDLAGDTITLWWELRGNGGSVYAPVASSVPISNSVANGDDYSDNQAISLSFTTPAGLLDGSNHGTLRLTASAEVSATTAEVQEEPPGPGPGPGPEVPAPGAVVLGGLGLGLVGWLRRRNTL